MMTEFWCPVLELSVVIPGILLAYLPATAFLKQRPGKLLMWLVPLLTICCLIGGMICSSLQMTTGRIMFVIIIFSICLYIHTLQVSLWKSISIALAVCAVFACVNSLSRAINAILIEESGLWFSIEGGLIYHLICWLFVLFAWYPATHAAKTLVEDENMAETWYIFWLLPIVFVGLNLFMIPRYDGTLYQGRILQEYLVISVVLLVILALFYAMFLTIANNLNKNARLQQENQFLAMQQTRYENLCSMIEETRHVRHDMRHHFQRLSILAAEEEWEDLKQYLTKASETLPNQQLQFSENRAVDSVIGHYCALAGREEIPFIAKVNLPKVLTVDEMDLCLILSNLLENALEANRRVEQKKRQIQIKLTMYSENLLLIYVENPFAGNIVVKNGVLQSSKRRGSGIGIQSVRRITEKNGGDCMFTYEKGIFTAKIVLRRKDK